MTQASFGETVTLALGVSDRHRSVAWYSDVLGFELLFDVQEIAWSCMSTHIPGVQIGFSDVESPQVGGAVPTFRVTDIDGFRDALERKGVRFDGPTAVHEGMVKLATFYDPDGHALMLSEVAEVRV